MLKRYLAVCLCASSVFATAQAGRPTGSLIVVPKTEEFVAGGTHRFDVATTARLLARQTIESIADNRVLVVRPPKGQDWQSYRQTLLKTGLYSSVEPDTLAMPTATSDDPSLNTQWHLFQISAPRAWDFEVGTNAPILAVVDGGVDLTHPDLAPNLVPGYNTISGLTQAQGGAVGDITTAGHGTRCAGIAAARGNNSVGVSGVGWNLRLMPVRATDNASGSSLRSELLEGVQWAVNNGAKVVSVSYTEVEYADVEAIGAWARTQGALLVWSAGNSNTNWANFDHDNVTVVGGTDQTDAKWYQSVSSGSGYGKGVDCFAPCSQIYTIKKGGTYGNAPVGVSFAVPQVAATLALMMGRSPSLSPAEIERRMLLRCSNMGPNGNDITYGYGRLNTGAAVEWPIRKYSLQALPTIGIPNATHVWPEKITDDGMVYGNVKRSSGGSVLARWQNGVLLGWTPLDQILPGPGDYVLINDVNENGLVAGQVWNSGGMGYRGFLWSTTTGPLLMPDAGAARSHMTGVNNLGQSVGWTLWNLYPSYFRTGQYRDASGTFSNPLVEAPYNITEAHKLFKLSEDGMIIGAIGNPGEQNFTFRSTSGISYCQSTGYLANDVSEATEEGAFITQSYTNSEVYVPNSFVFSAKGLITTNLGPSSVAMGLNESLEVVGGLPSSNGADWVRAMIYQGYNPGVFTDKLVPLADNPNTVLPPNVTGFKVLYDVNNFGQIVAQATTTLGIDTGYVANPVDTPGLAVSLGQLGASPTYVGSIPPALNVTFTHADGTPYAGGTVNLNYASSIGRLSLNPPATVTGNYRVFLRCNPTAIPGYTGPIFLSRLYPPLNQQAVPRDAFYLPYDSGTSYGGQPILEMYPGDCDGSGEIDAADIDVVIAHFGGVSGDPGWDSSVDVDGTGEIDAADIDLVIANFGLVSDPEP